MNKKTITYFVVIAVAMVFALYYFMKVNIAQVEAVTKATPSASTPENQSPSSHSATSAASKVVLRTPPPFLTDVHDFKELNTKVAQAGQSNADALKIKSVGLLLCQQSDSEMDQALARRKAKGKSSPNDESSLSAFKAYRRRFCVGLDGESVGRTLGELITADPSGDYLVSTTLGNDADKERASTMARAMIETSSSPEAINNAALYLAYADAGWDFGKEAVQGTYLSSQLPQIQIMAASMVACDLSGGCGPDGMYSWAACSNYGNCHPGVSMDEIWKQTNSPDLVGAAVKLANILRSKRTKG